MKYLVKEDWISVGNIGDMIHVIQILYARTYFTVLRLCSAGEEAGENLGHLTVVKYGKIWYQFLRKLYRNCTFTSSIFVFFIFIATKNL